MATLDHPRFVLVGGGLAGALQAAYLGRAGYQVDLYERRPDPDAGNFVGGRSINLAISARGLHALEQIGLAEEVLRGALAMPGRMIHARDGALHFQPYDKDPSRHINSIGRAALNSLTIAAARRMPNVRVHFNQRCTDVDFDRPAATLVHAETGQTTEAAGDILLGLDGAYSAVRRAMQRLDRFDYSQSYLRHGYKELTIPPASDGGSPMERHALHIWPRRSFMMIALPNPDGSFTCTLFLQFEEADARRDAGAGAAARPWCFANLRTDDDVRRFFDEQFPDAVPRMPTLLEDFRRNPTGSMVTVRCYPWQHAGRVALLGDAAHAVVPFYGQGANASFEDVAVFEECRQEHAPDWSRVMDAYQQRRKPHADAIADLALANFVEMRDKTGSRTFRAYKKLERTLHTALPSWYTPLYTLVSFTRTPYADAVARARRQNRVVAGVALSAIALILIALLMLAAWLGRG